ncbi:hypothetical protein PHISP_07824 [Aspergillus sp. HF37]|nr:hypothetical protein PHISP_07824 [Aspergillus sp. HF37]
MDNNQQTRLQRLARTRENQRKSRARKQEHVQDLEQKLAVCQDDARRKDVEHRLAMQKLEAENRKLRRLLSFGGLPSNAVDQYVQAADDPAMARKVAIPALRQSEMRSAIPDQPTDGAAGSKDKAQSPAARCGAADDGVRPNTVPHGPQRLEQTQKCQSVCSCPPDDDCNGSWPADEDVLNTTLCAIAAELISQYNTRGVDMEEIRQKLWAGFRKGLNSGGECRVQNQVLFQVLDEISND